MHWYIRMCMHMCSCEGIYVCVYGGVCMYVHMCVRGVYISVNVSMYVCKHVCSQVTQWSSLVDWMRIATVRWWSIFWTAHFNNQSGPPESPKCGDSNLTAYLPLFVIYMYTYFMTGIPYDSLYHQEIRSHSLVVKRPSDRKISTMEVIFSPSAPQRRMIRSLKYGSRWAIDILLYASLISYIDILQGTRVWLRTF